jgi:parallel beta-helix repeat protein
MIGFNIPGAAGSHIIEVESLLPPIEDAVTIDATSQSGYSSAIGPVIEISGHGIEKACAGVESGVYRDYPGLDVVYNSSGDASGTTIKGLKISNFCQAISVSATLEALQTGCSSTGTSDQRISDILVQDNMFEGNLNGNSALDLCRAENSLLKDNQFYNNGDHIETSRSQDIVIEGNEGTVAQDAIELVRSHDVTIRNNRFSDNRRGGIALVFESYNNQILDNEIVNVAAMGLTLSNDNIVRGNTITGSGWFGIEFRGASGNTVIENTVTHNGLGGMAVNAGTLNGLDDCPTFDENGNPDPTEDCNVQFTVVDPNVQGDAFNNVIMDNEIAFNHGPGIVVGNSFVDLAGVERHAAYNTLSRNRIFANDGLGIDLTDETQNQFWIVEEPFAGLIGQIVLADGDGVTANNSGILANNGQNYPILSSALATPGQLVVKGTIETADPRTVTIEFFANATGDSSGHGQGATFLGTASANRLGKFTATVPPVPEGTRITATATDAAGNTSEFATNVAATSP